MNYDVLKGQVRHIIGLIGGVLIGIGVSDADAVNTVLGNYDAVVGGVLAIGAFAASAVAKIKGLFSGE